MVMSLRAERVRRWREATKARIVKAMGGKCVCCGYNKCNSALALHHLDNQEKEFGFGKIYANPVSWKRIVPELRKCVLVCHNCHSEVHMRMTEIPKNCTKFNESFVTYKIIRLNAAKDICPFCGRAKSELSKTCSRSCSARNAIKVDWNSVDLKSILENSKINDGRIRWDAIGEKLGITGEAVKKRSQKVGLI
jgi:hypothetical protein